MSETPSEPSAQADPLASLRTAGAARFDAVGWHYIEVLAERAGTQTGTAQTLLRAKLDQALEQFQTRLSAIPGQPHKTPPAPSPLSILLSDMAQHAPALQASSAGPLVPANRPTGWRAESPRVQQFKKQLSQISVQRQVKQAIAMAPQNAGPINSHMLVLRSLGLMRDASTDYLNRFMAHVDTLLRLDESGTAKKTKTSR